MCCANVCECGDVWKCILCRVPEGGSLFFQTTAEAYLKMTDEQKNRYDDYRSSTVGKVTNMGTTTVDRVRYSRVPSSTALTSRFSIPGARSTDRTV